MKELVIASNMIALARGRKGSNKRSAMLRMIMPFLSRDTGDKLASAIDKRDSAHFAKEWDKVKKEITGRLSIQHKKNADKHMHGRHKATGADVHTFARDDATSISVQTWGAPEKIRLNINGNNVFDGIAPLENNEPCEQAVDPIGKGITSNGTTATIQIDSGTTGNNYQITDPQVVDLIKMVCERLLMDADPCPIPEKDEQKACFDYNANMLELYDRLVASSI